VAIDASSGRPTPASDGLAFLVPQKAPGRMVRVTEDPFPIEDDDRFVELIEHLNPPAAEIVSDVACHASITAGQMEFIRSQIENRRNLEAAADRPVLPDIPANSSKHGLNPKRTHRKLN